MKKKILLVTPGTFHYFELAKALIKKKQLNKIISGYPKFKLTKYNLSKKYLISSGFYQIIFQILKKLRINLFNSLESTIQILNFINLDKLSKKYLDQTSILLSLSGCGVESGKLFKKKNKIFICERSSSHILFANKILKEEYKKYKINFSIDQRIIKRELAEYKNADFVLVPSKFVEKTFKDYNFYNTKVLSFPSNNKIFKMINKNKNRFYGNNFKLVFVGSLSLRKGLPYLLDSFNNLKINNKELHLVGEKTNDYELFKHKINFKNTILHGHISQQNINKLFNNSHLFVLPSLEEGAAVVVAQAMSAGLPVIVSKNTGWSDIVSKNKNGLIVNARDSKNLTKKIKFLNNNRNLLLNYSNNCLKYSKNQSWDKYVDRLNDLIENK